MWKVRMEMRKNNYTSFFKIKPKKVEKYIRCKKCGGNMEEGIGYPYRFSCPKCGYTVYPKPYEPDCIKLPETLEEYFELYEKIRTKNELL
jgi:tRNA(Ile2) C34 agmatinyltransferase TiaS|nr:MAG TPA: putative DNA-binding protein [Caudoviricetes sp.]